jgi:hypothetical protein
MNRRAEGGEAVHCKNNVSLETEINMQGGQNNGRTIKRKGYHGKMFEYQKGVWCTD